MSTTELLAAVKAAGIILGVVGDRLTYNAPKGAMTPELRVALTGHKPALLAVLAPVTELVSLKGGLTSPLPAVLLALDLERRRIPLVTDQDHQFIVPDDTRLTAADYASIQRWRHHLGAIVEYVAPQIA